MEYKFGTVKGAITHKVDDLSPLFMQGMIPLFSVNVGDVVDIDTRTSPASTSCLIVKCQKGDYFTVTATGGTQAMPWAFLDTEKRLLSKAGPNVSVENLTVVAPEDGYFISCSTNTADPPFAVSSNQYFRFKETQNTLDNITNGAYFDKNLTSLFVAGIIPLFDINVGDTVDTKTLVSFSTGGTLIVPCLKGDIFTVTGTGGVQARPWAFLDTSKKLLSKANSSISVENLSVIAEQDGYFISSCVNNSAPPFNVTAHQLYNFSVMNNTIENVENVLMNYNQDLSGFFEDGLVPLYTPAVGDVVDIDARSAVTSNKCLVIACQKGDKFIVSATGGVQGRPWAFVDEEKRLLSKADGNTSVENYEVEATTNGYFISSCTNSSEVPFSVYADRFCDVKTTVSNTKNLMNMAYVEGRNLASLFLPGLIPLYSPAIGDIVDIDTRISQNNCKCLVVKCQAGDTFTVTATGGVQARPWAFLDTDKRLLSKADGNTSVENLTVRADVNGYFISSGVNTSPFIVIANQFIDLEYIYNKVDGVSNEYGEPSYKLLTDPYLLNFRYGQLSVNGNYTHNVTTLTLRDAIPVKAGDIITVENDCQLQVIHSVDGAKAFSDAALKYTVANDGNITIGIRYSDQRNLDNNKILDKLHLELHTIVDRLRGDNRDRVFFGRVPMSGWYLGKHTDTSGFNQDTNYDAVIAAWDALVNSPYITKEDLGLSEDSQHIYCYHIKPPELSSTLNGKRHPRVVVVTGQHGHEKTGSYGLLYLIRDMLDNPMSDPILHYLRDNIEFAIIPVANPWGWNNNSRYNINGVNINRNFGSYNWAELTDESYVTPFEYNYKGTAPFSEAETRVIRGVVTKYSDAPIIIDWHTLGGSPGTTSYLEMGWFSHPYYFRNEYDDKLANACMTMLESTKSYFDGVYEVNGGVGQAYCEYAMQPNVPSLPTWAFESTNSLSTTLETCNGSKDAFLGNKLRFYSADIIKMSAEMFANYLITILRELAK